MSSACRSGGIMRSCELPSSNSSNKWQHLRKDQLVDPASAKALFEQAASSTKSFETDAFSSSQHEIFNEDTLGPLGRVPGMSTWVLMVQGCTGFFDTRANMIA